MYMVVLISICSPGKLAARARPRERFQGVRKEKKSKQTVTKHAQRTKTAMTKHLSRVRELLSGSPVSGNRTDGILKTNTKLSYASACVYI